MIPEHLKVFYEVSEEYEREVAKSIAKHKKRQYITTLVVSIISAIICFTSVAFAIAVLMQELIL